MHSTCRGSSATQPRSSGAACGRMPPVRRPPGNGSPVLQWGWGLLQRGRQACACTGGSTETGGRAEGAQLPLKGVPPALEVAPHASSVLDAFVKGCGSPMRMCGHTLARIQGRLGLLILGLTSQAPQHCRWSQMAINVTALSECPAGIATTCALSKSMHCHAIRLPAGTAGCALLTGSGRNPGRMCRI